MSSLMSDTKWELSLFSPLPSPVWLLSSAVTLAVLLGATPCQVEFRDSDTVSYNPFAMVSVSQRKTAREADRNIEKDELKQERRLIVTVWNCVCLMWPTPPTNLIGMSWKLVWKLFRPVTWKVIKIVRIRLTVLAWRERHFDCVAVK